MNPFIIIIQICAVCLLGVFKLIMPVILAPPNACKQTPRKWERKRELGSMWPMGLLFASLMPIHHSWTCFNTGTTRVPVPIHSVRDWPADMSGTKPSPNMGRNTAEHKQQQKIQKGRALTQMYLLSSSVVSATPSTGPRIWESFKLPLLTNMAHQRMPG